MTTTRRNQRRPLPPARKNGNLYYLRLKTPMGLMYKLGFTTLGSAQERLAYQGNGDEKYIDSVLCFVYLEDAWDVEQMLHSHFKSKALFHGGHESMPLFRNGQTEIYRHDILAMDKMRKEEQAEKTRVTILASDYKSQGATDESVKELVKNIEDDYRNSWYSKMKVELAKPSAPPSLGVRAIAVVVRPISWLIFGCAVAVHNFLFGINKASQARIDAAIERIKQASYEEGIKERLEILRAYPPPLRR